MGVSDPKTLPHVKAALNDRRMQFRKFREMLAADDERILYLSTGHLFQVRIP